MKDVEMATSKETYRCIIHTCKLCGLLVLPFLLSFISIDKLDGKQSICLVKNLFGVECLGCGITKAVISAVQFDFSRAFAYNKLIVIVLPLMIYLWIKEIAKTVKMLKIIQYK